uniref:Carrier domain-containing protein n=1 Tax=Ascaris lumbricoides TaxID=6252 RepID=A0A0M3IHN1_ASCLU
MHADEIIDYMHDPRNSPVDHDGLQLASLSIKAFLCQVLVDMPFSVSRSGPFAMHADEIIDYMHDPRNSPVDHDGLQPASQSIEAVLHQVLVDMRFSVSR